jgi:hypothetical protein
MKRLRQADEKKSTFGVSNVELEALRKALNFTFIPFAFALMTTQSP